MLEDDVAPIDIPQVSKTFKKSCVIRPCFIGTPSMPENTNSGDPACLLRVGRERSSRGLRDCHRTEMRDTPPVGTP